MRGFPPDLVRFAVACVAFVDIIPGLPACSGGIRGHWMMLLLLPSAGLPACSCGIRRNVLFLLLSLLAGFPPALVDVEDAVVMLLLLSFLANVSRSGAILVIGNPILRMFQVLALLLGWWTDWGEGAAPRRELQKGPK